MAMAQIREFDPLLCCDHAWKVVTIRTTAGADRTLEVCAKPSCQARCHRDEHGQIVLYELGVRV